MISKTLTTKNLSDLLDKNKVRELLLKYQEACGLGINFQIINISRHLVLSPKTFALLYEIDDQKGVHKVRVNASSEETRERAFQVMKFLEKDFSGPKFFIPKVFFYDKDYNLICYENIDGQLLINQLNDLHLPQKISLAGQWLKVLHSLAAPNFVLPKHEIFFNFEALGKFYPELAQEGPTIVQSLKAKLSSIPSKLIHGDYQPNNMIIGEEKITVFDLNDRQNADSALDLGKFLTQLKTMLFRFADLKNFEDLTSIFLSAYGLNYHQGNFKIYQKLYFLQILCSLSASLAEDPESKRTLPQIYQYYHDCPT